jgi:transposase InsO family protein
MRKIGHYANDNARFSSNPNQPTAVSRIIGAPARRHFQSGEIAGPIEHPIGERLFLSVSVVNLVAEGSIERGILHERVWFLRHIDIAEVRTEDGKLHLFVAIDRTSKFAVVELHEKATTRVAADFLRALIKAVPYKVYTVLTDNGIHFTTPGNKTSAASDIKQALERGEIFRAHAFESACAQNDIDQRLTKPKHSWTTDVIDKCFLFRFAIFSCCARVTARQRARCEVRSLKARFTPDLMLS